MSRKDLSRTVIEGGRYHRNRWARRASHGIARARTREWLSQVEDDPDEAEASVPVPKTPVGKMFYDKLAPAFRWIAAQVDRPWAKVRADLFARFDTRTTAGRHIVFDHMLKSVHEHGLPTEARGGAFYVDAHGILRDTTWLGLPERRLIAKLETWRAGRRAVLLDRGWWWIELVIVGERCVICYRNTPHEKEWHRAHYVARGPLTRGEIRYLRKLPDWGYRQVAIDRDRAGLSATLKPR